MKINSPLLKGLEDQAIAGLKKVTISFDALFSQINVLICALDLEKKENNELKQWANMHRNEGA